MTRKLFFLLAVIGVMAAFSCSSKTTTPTVPDNSFFDLPIPQINDVPGRTLLGTWTITFDTENLDFEINSSRLSEMHYNATHLIPSPEIVINGFDPSTCTIDVDVTISNPYPVDVYDVRLIIYTDAVGHILQNDDGWTSLHDIPGGWFINPFRAYAKDQPNCVFAGETECTENLKIFLPGGNSNVSFAIDASFPDNCEEPYKIVNFSQDVLYNQIGSSAMIHVDVYDWENDVNEVNLYCPAITGTTFVPFIPYIIHIGYSSWKMELGNNTGAAGELTGFIIASSANSGSLQLYKPVVIMVHKLENWVHIWGNDIEDDPNFSNQGNSVAIDSVGSIYVTGYFTNGTNGSTDFDPGPEEDWHSAAGYRDAFLCKYDSQMNYLWACTWGGEKLSYGSNLVFDDAGNIYLTGSFKGEVDFDPGPGENIHFSKGSYDSSLSKFDPDGNFIWVRTWGGTGQDHYSDISIDNSGNLYIPGFFRNTVDFDPGPGVYELVSNGNYDACLSKFDPDGNFIWALSWGGVYKDFGRTTALYDSDHVYVAGTFEDVVDFDPSADGVVEHASNGYRDIFLSKFDADGKFIWVKVWGGISYDYCGTLSFDDDGNMYGSGTFEDVVDFDPGVQVDEHTSVDDENDAFLSKFDRDGNLIWARTWGGIDEDRTIEIATYHSEYIYVTGDFQGSSDFDPGPGSFELNSYGQADVYVSKFDTDGNFIWVRRWGGYDPEISVGIDTNSSGDIFFTGGFMSPRIDFDPGPEEYIRSAIGYQSIFLIKLLPNGYWE